MSHAVRATVFLLLAAATLTPRVSHAGDIFGQFLDCFGGPSANAYPVAAYPVAAYPAAAYPVAAYPVAAAPVVAYPAAYPVAGYPAAYPAYAPVAAAPQAVRPDNAIDINMILGIIDGINRLRNGGSTGSGGGESSAKLKELENSLNRLDASISRLEAGHAELSTAQTELGNRVSSDLKAMEDRLTAVEDTVKKNTTRLEEALEQLPASFNYTTNAEVLLAPSEEAIGGTQGTKLPAGTSIAIIGAQGGAKVVKVRARLDGREIDGWLGRGFLTP